MCSLKYLELEQLIFIYKVIAVAAHLTHLAVKYEMIVQFSAVLGTNLNFAVMIQ